VKNAMSSILHPGAASVTDPDFPCAPVGWTEVEGLHKAADEGITLTDAHLDVIAALQDYFSKHGSKKISARDVHDALDEKFHAQGGLKYLYMLFPGGPIAQGCRIAGLEPPVGSSSPGSGSVQ
jgi:TusE/DsrC/DsvC family sulfur relay protein